VKDYLLNIHNLQHFLNEIQDELAVKPMLLVTTGDPSIGKWGMAQLWRTWMASTATWMAKQGATMPLCLNPDGSHYGSRPFNKDDAHELFTVRWLGTDADGTRLSWAMKGHDGMRAATKGERFNALRQHEEWATERGLVLMKPRDSEYAKLEKEQNE